MLHTNFQGHVPFGSEEEDVLRFLPYMGMPAILVMWSGPFEQTFIPQSHGAPYQIWLWLAKQCLRDRCLKSVDDGRRRPTYPRSSPVSLWLRWDTTTFNQLFWRSSLIRLCTVQSVCQFFCLFWTHLCMVKPHCSVWSGSTLSVIPSTSFGHIIVCSPCSNFRIITAITSGIPIFEPSHDKTNKVTYVPNEDSDQPGHPPLWSEASLCIVWVAKDLSFLHMDREVPDQTGQKPRLIWVFTGRTCHFAGFVMRRLICNCYCIPIFGLFVVLTFQRRCISCQDEAVLSRWWKTENHLYPAHC